MEPEKDKARDFMKLQLFIRQTKKHLTAVEEGK